MKKTTACGGGILLFLGTGGGLSFGTGHNLQLKVVPLLEHDVFAVIGQQAQRIVISSDFLDWLKIP
jgi:hypothetical protein